MCATIAILAATDRLHIDNTHVEKRQLPTNQDELIGLVNFKLYFMKNATLIKYNYKIRSDLDYNQVISGLQC